MTKNGVEKTSIRGWAFMDKNGFLAFLVITIIFGASISIVFFQSEDKDDAKDESETTVEDNNDNNSTSSHEYAHDHPAPTLAIQSITDAQQVVNLTGNASHIHLEGIEILIEVQLSGYETIVVLPSSNGSWNASVSLSLIHI